MKRILLMGNPNVGKSALFARLTATRVMSSNYPGTTVEVSSGKVKVGWELMELVDVPGAYSLEPTSRAEEVAAEMLPGGDLIINAVDATQLERNLFLTMQLLASGKPVIVALNMIDEARHKGIRVDARRLEARLGVPVIETCALSGEGIRALAGRLGEARSRALPHLPKDRWALIGEIVQEAQTIKHHHHTPGEFLSDLTLHPVTGIPFAAVVIFACFQLVRFIGEGIVRFLLDPLAHAFWLPGLMSLSRALEKVPWLHTLLIGQLFQGRIHFEESLGLLSTGLYVPLVMVLPYVFAFYLALGLLEDTGYLPRLGILLDAPLHRLGLHGFAVIPLLLGGGCHVPGILSTRMLESRAQRLTTTVLIVVCVPCMGQTAMIYGYLSRFGASGPLLVFAALALVGLFLAWVLKLFNRTEIPEMFVEIPPYRRPDARMLALKVWLRTRQFLADAIPYILLGVLIMNLLYASHALAWIGRAAAPVIAGLLGLPPDTAA
ncbi:MAG: ferrous iron transporter B, partial [Candidatus Firestonebacteria bacterium]|nr:ferrous iron transporter B [Candidatus Firestonebacteria bacterium]